MNKPKIKIKPEDMHLLKMFGNILGFPGETFYYMPFFFYQSEEDAKENLVQILKYNELPDYAKKTVDELKLREDETTTN